MKTVSFLLGLLLAASVPAAAVTFTVTTAEDISREPEKGYSLRDAINDANATAGPDRIVFAIPAGGGVARIVLTNELPTLRETVEIDGYTQAGARPNTLSVGNNAVLRVEIDASRTEANFSRGIFIRAEKCLVRGLILNNSLEAGLIVSFGNENVIVGNWIGVQADGSTPSAGRGNRDGVWIVQGARNRIGGPNPADRNLISGNHSTGITIDGAEAADNIILNNYIGTDWSGMVAVPNQIGIWLAGGTNSVGDGSAVGRNIISGNSAFGMQVSPWSGPRPKGNRIAGNYIGLAADGDQPLPNLGTGIVLVDAEQNTVGGVTSGAGNVISGNGQAGVFLISRYGASSDPGISTSGNVILGNLVGTDATGLKARGNGGTGIILQGDLFGTLSDNRIGGVELGVRVGNVIAGNQGNGIQVTGAKATGTIIEANFIGVDKTGTKALPNEWGGVLVGPQEDDPGNGSPRSTRIGGMDASGFSGNVISGNKFDGIALDFAPTATESTGGGHVIQGNLIGTDLTGRVKIPNEQFGISLRGACSSCQIGGDQPLARNIVSGNRWDGIGLLGERNTLCRILGNFIGTDKAGNAALPNGLNGISLGSAVTPRNGARANYIGGTVAGERNIISGNGGQGIFIGNGSENWIQGNYIGLDVTGRIPLGNQTCGVAISAPSAAQLSSTNHIGSALAGGGNWIGGNHAGGVVIEGTNAIGNILRGNFIGTDPSGAIGLGNVGTGVRLTDAIGTVLGRGPAGIPDSTQANVIKYNDGYGIQVTGDWAINNCFRGNIVAANTDQAVLLGATVGGVPNDPGDNDKGPNALMNFPMVVRSYFDSAAGVTRISGRVDSAQRQQLIVDFYRMLRPPGGRSGEAEEYLTSTTPDRLGRFCAQVPGDLRPAVVTATATSPEGSTSGFSRAAPAKYRLKALEVIQSVQDWSNSVPLIDGKRTLVRAFIEPLAGGSVEVMLGDLEAKLHAFQDGQALPNSPQPPANLNNVQCDTDSGKQRTNSAGSVNFLLPSTWHAGAVELQFEADGVVCDEPDSVGEPAAPCRDCGTTLAFYEVPPLELIIGDVMYEDGGVFHVNDPADLGMVERLIESAYPVAELIPTRKLVSVGAWPAADRCELVNEKLQDLTSWFSNVRALGLIPLGPGIVDYNGLAVGIPGDVASAYFSVPFGDKRVTPLHELGHAFGRAHAVLAVHAVDASGSLVGGCNEARDPAGDPLFPFGFLDPVDGQNKAALGPMNAGANSIVYGIDLLSDVESSPIMDPTQIFAMMSYCKETVKLDRWISSFNYRRLMADFMAGAPGPRPASLRPQMLNPTVREFLIIRGRANLRAGTVEFRPFSRWQGAAPEWQPSLDGAYQLQMLDAAGRVLLQTSFDPKPYDACGRELSLFGGFRIPVPWDPAFREARVFRKGVLLLKRTSSAQPPVVTTVLPNGGERISTPDLNISWEAQDPDGDALTYDVEFSADAGTSWDTLQSETRLTRFAVPRSTLPGTARALVRVTASDGFQTASRTSASVFSLPDQPPRLQVLSPAAGQWYQPGQQYAFAVVAQDVEDGRLSGTNIVWYGGNGIRLGTGTSLIGNTDKLTKGEQKIRVIAFDGSGQGVTNTIPITVSDSPLTEYTDLNVQATVLPIEAAPGEKMTWTLQVQNRGSVAANAVQLTNRFSRAVGVLSVQSSQGSWMIQNGAILANLGQIPAQGQATLTYVAATGQPGGYKSVIQVSSSEPDVSPSDNLATVEAIVSTMQPLLPDLVVTVEQSPLKAQPGELGNYFTTVSNSGLATGTQVMLTNVVPAGVTVLSSEISAGGTISAAGQEVRARFNSLAPGSQAWLRLHVRIDGVGPILFKAAGHGAEQDHQPLDNFMTSIVSPGSGSDITVTRDGNLILIEWAEAKHYRVDQSDALGAPSAWRSLQTIPVLVQGRWRLTVQPTTQTRFYRFNEQ